GRRAERATREVAVRARAARPWRLRHGRRLGERRRRDEREHGKGPFLLGRSLFGTLLGHCGRPVLKSFRYFGSYIAASWDARRLARRLACRVVCTPHGCSAEHPNDSRRSAVAMPKALHLLCISGVLAAIPVFSPVRRTVWSRLLEARNSSRCWRQMRYGL